LYGFEAWFLAIREKHRFGMVESRVLRVICGPQKEDVAGGWRKLHEDLHN
jgi:hypothetical protein